MQPTSVTSVPVVAVDVPVIAVDAQGLVIEEKSDIDTLGGNEEQESNQDGDGDSSAGMRREGADGTESTNQNGGGGGGGGSNANAADGRGGGGATTHEPKRHQDVVSNQDFLANFKLPARLQHLQQATPARPLKAAPPSISPEQNSNNSLNGANDAAPSHHQQLAAADTVAISAPSYTSILIIGEMNRAGSNELMELLSTIPESFALYEPFRNFKYVGMLPLPGSFSTLYSCNFKDDGAVTSKVVWPGDARKVMMGQLLNDYQTEGIPRRGDAKLKSMPEPDYSILINATAGVETPFRTVWARINATRYNFQREERLDHASVQQIGRICNEAQVRIVKTIRFTGYVRVLPEQVKETVKVIYLIRHPEGLLQAQADAKKKEEAKGSSEPVSCGGHVAPNCNACGSVSHYCNGGCTWNAEKGKCQASFVNDHHGAVIDLCKRMSGGLQAVASMDPSQVHYLRYEDLARQPVEVTRIVYDFLGIPFTPEVSEKVNRVAARQIFDDHIDPSRLLIDAATSWPQDVVKACSNLVAYGYI